MPVCPAVDGELRYLNCEVMRGVIPDVLLYVKMKTLVQNQPYLVVTSSKLLGFFELGSSVQ